VVAARRVEQAEAIARGTTDIRASDFASASVKAEAATAGLIVNATPLGMDGDAIPLDPSVLEPGQVVVDLVYHPQLTPLVRSARARGLTAFNGLGMLVHQAALSFEAWTGVAAPLDAMRAAVS